MKVVWIAALVAVAALASRSAAAADDKGGASKSKDDAANPPSVIISMTTERPSQSELGPRPAILKSLYAASIGLQAFDGYSTMAGLRAGNVELNPAMKSIAQSPTTLLVAKATMTLTTIAVAEQLWRTHHRGQAIAVMAISNGIMAAVAAKNASVLR